MSIMFAGWRAGTWDRWYDMSTCGVKINGRLRTEETFKRHRNICMARAVCNATRRCCFLTLPLAPCGCIPDIKWRMERDERLGDLRACVPNMMDIVSELFYIPRLEG